MESYKQNQLILGDCLNVLPTLSHKIARLIFIDAPYYTLNKENLKFKDRADVILDADFDHFENYAQYIEFIAKSVEKVSPTMQDDSYFLSFFAGQYITDLMHICETNDMIFKSELIWHKLNPMPSVRHKNFSSACEFLLLMMRGNPPFNFLGQKKMHNIIRMPICSGNERRKDYSQRNEKGDFPNLHPTQKPERLIAYYLKILSQPDDLIIDYFSGVGTTNVVCKKEDRFCVGIEKNVKYYNPALERLNTTLKRNPKKQIKLFPDKTPII